MNIKFDLHIHSNFSHDSKMSVKRIIKISKKKGLDGIAITDHNTLKGAILAEELAKDSNFKIIRGEEISTDIGDVLGLFLKKEIKPGIFSKVIKEIKKQGGVAILPHPALYHIITDEVIKKVDAIEIFNSKVGEGANKMALELAKKYKKTYVAGSDAHSFLQLGLGITTIKSANNNNDIKRAILTGKTEIEQKKINLLLKILIKFVSYWRKYVS